MFLTIKDGGGVDLVVCCILTGAAYFAIDLSRILQHYDFEHSIYFVEASSCKGEEQVFKQTCTFSR